MSDKTRTHSTIVGLLKVAELSKRKVERGPKSGLSNTRSNPLYSLLYGSTNFPNAGGDGHRVLDAALVRRPTSYVHKHLLVLELHRVSILSLPFNSLLVFEYTGNMSSEIVNIRLQARFLIILQLPGLLIPLRLLARRVPHINLSK